MIKRNKTNTTAVVKCPCGKAQCAIASVQPMDEDALDLYLVMNMNLKKINGVHYCPECPEHRQVPTFLNGKIVGWGLF